MAKLAESITTTPRVTAIVLTKNEERNLEKCLASLAELERVIVMDCGSTDATASIASRFDNVDFKYAPWQGYALSFNHAATHVDPGHWILRIDADEELVGDIHACLAKTSPEANGLVITRTIKFLGKALKYGPHANLRSVRVFRAGLGACEATKQDPHVVVSGSTDYEPGLRLIDDDRKPFDQWLEKHIRYAKREATQVLSRKKPTTKNLDAPTRAKRILKQNVYYRLPPFLRPVLYFLFRLLAQRECLGGRAGISWCVMQGLLYRMLVDFYILNRSQLSNSSQSN